MQAEVVVGGPSSPLPTKSLASTTSLLLVSPRPSSRSRNGLLTFFFAVPTVQLSCIAYDTINSVILSSLSLSQYIPRLRPRILHRSLRCARGDNGPGRVASYWTSSPVKSWWAPESTEEQEASSGNRTHDARAPPATSKADRKVISNFYRTRTVSNKRIHILGLESQGRFLAHTLRQLPNPPPVTLVFHGWAALKAWEASPQKIRVTADGDAESAHGFDAELAFARPRYHGKEVKYREAKPSPLHPRTGIQQGESTEPISCLVVCTRSTGVLQLLSAVKHRLRKDSVILFLQKGMGIVDEVNQAIFPDPETRPQYMVGVDSHLVQSDPNAPYGVAHRSFGTLSLTILPLEREVGTGPYPPRDEVEPFKAGVRPAKWPSSSDPNGPTEAAQQAMFDWSSSSRYLLRTLLRAPVLCATAFAPSDLMQLQLEKLAVNSIIGPLSVMLDSRNGAILYNYALTRTMRLLLAETSLVIRSLPELQYIPNVSQRFDPGRLETSIIGAANRSSDDISPMLKDVRKGQQTDVDYLNGWIVRRGEELGVRCVMNYMMLNLVKGKQALVQRELLDEVPQLETKLGESAVDVRDVVAEAPRKEWPRR